MIIRIDWLGPSTNALKGRHWSEYNKHKKAAKQALGVALAQQYPKDIPSISPPVKITLRAFIGKGRKAYDLDNYVMCYKMLVDSLVDVGILPDDRDKYVSAFQIERPARFKEWWREGFEKQSHIMLEIEEI